VKHTIISDDRRRSCKFDAVKKYDTVISRVAGNGGFLWLLCLSVVMGTDSAID